MPRIMSSRCGLSLKHGEGNKEVQLAHSYFFYFIPLLLFLGLAAKVGMATVFQQDARGVFQLFKVSVHIEEEQKPSASRLHSAHFLSNTNPIHPFLLSLTITSHSMLEAKCSKYVLRKTAACVLAAL